MENFVETKWAVITPVEAQKKCDITSMAAAVFTVDLNAFETACAAADGCTFDKTAYEPLALGFLWDDVDSNCSSVFGPYIMNKPDANALPFEGLYWNGGHMGFDLGVTYNAATNLFSWSTFEACAPFDFLDGCFADLRANDFKLAFSLLKSTVGLEEGTT
jgi:hypothetical protein